MNTEKKHICPICGKQIDEKYTPFCSKRCADIDLHRWMNGVYRIETEETIDDSPESANTLPESQDSFDTF